MQESGSRTSTVVTVSLMIALEIILTRFVSINTPVLRIGFGVIPIIIIALLYGPLWAGGAYALGDVIGALMFPTGAFFPGFTLSALLTGLVYGFILHGNKVTWPRVLASCSIVMLLINLVLNTYWLSILMGKGYLALLPGRFVKELISIPVYALIIMAIDRTVIPAIKRI